MSPVQAVSAASFENSIGVNVHLSDNAGPYGNLAMVETELSYLGVDQVRDNQPYDWSVGFYQSLAAAGIKLDLIIGHNPNEAMTTAGLQADLALIDQIEAAVPGGVIALEGLNEPANFPNTWNGAATANWTVVEQVQAAEYQLVQADPSLRTVPLLGTSSDPNSFSGTPPDMDAIANFGNAHVYPYTGGQPTFVLNNIVSGQQQLEPGEKAWVTEFGYSTAYLDPNYGCDQLTQAKNTLNGLLEAFAGGVPKTFIYQLNDEIANPSPSDVGNNWGLFNANGTMKLAATAIHDLTTILGDTGAPAMTFTPGQIGYTISNLPSTGHSLLLEKSGGTYDLAVWNDAVDWNAATNTDVTVAPATTTIAFASTWASIAVYDPLIGIVPIATYSNAASVQIALTDHPLIIEVSGSGSVTPSHTSPNDTVVTNTTSAITDAGGTAWTITTGGQVAVNGVADAVTSGVIELTYVNGVIWQENSNKLWWGETQNNDAWAPQAGTAASPLPAVTASPNGTAVAAWSKTGLTDASGNTWTITAGGQVAINGMTDTKTSAVIELAYVNGTMWQENAAALWRGETQPNDSWAPSAGTLNSPLPAPVLNGAKITTAGPALTDQAGTHWTLVQSATQGLQIAANGTVDAVTSNVVRLELLDGAVVQQNTSGNWYSEPGASGPWSQIAAVTPEVDVTSAVGAYAINGVKIATTTDAGTTVGLTASRVANAAIGATAVSLRFIAMAAVTVAGGSAASTISVDGGKNSFISGTGTMDITGGTGRDSYVYHQGGGLMTIEDFWRAKGDTLTIDKSLQASMKQGSDGHGGLLLNFGTIGQGVDIRDAIAIPSSLLHFA